MEIVFLIFNGAFAVTVTGMLFFLIEQRWPILHDLTAEQNDLFARCDRLMMFCVWLVVTAGNIFLRWPNDS